MKSKVSSLASLLLVAVTASAAATSIAGCSRDGDDEGTSEDAVSVPIESIMSILANIPEGTSWATADVRTKFLLEAHARVFFYERYRKWGRQALRVKEKTLLESATPAMTANFDRIVKFLVSADVPAEFVASRDIVDGDLAKQLRRLYLVYEAERRHLITVANPEFKDWDGGDIREFLVQDEKTLGEQKEYAADVERELNRIVDGSLSPVERAIRAKALFFARQLKYGATGFNTGGDDARQVGTSAGWLFDYVSLYAGKAITPDDETWLRAVNAHTFQELLYMNAGTVKTMDWDLPTYTDPTLMSEYGLEPSSRAGKGYLTLATLWLTRVTASDGATRRCTVYSAQTRSAMWDAFTADNLSNADGSQTLEGYSATYRATAAERTTRTRAIAKDAVMATFPDGSTSLTAAQRGEVLAAIDGEKRPAAVLETTYAALDRATGGAVARQELEKAFSELETVGGNYAPGAEPRPEDVNTVQAMYRNVRSYLARHYGGYRVDIAALAPESVRVTTGDSSYASIADGSITIGLANSWVTASLYSTILHETKHAIDGKSKAPVIGAAWEGGGLAVEWLVWPRFIEEVMAAEATRLPHYRLGTDIDNVRLTATTDATLQVYLRDACDHGTPNSFDFVKDIVRGYGYSDEATLVLRAHRAHMGMQYLSYDYGSVIVQDQVRWLQSEVGAAVTVDPFLLQACGIASADRTPQVLASFKACIAR